MAINNTVKPFNFGFSNPAQTNALQGLVSSNPPFTPKKVGVPLNTGTTAPTGTPAISGAVSNTNQNLNKATPATPVGADLSREQVLKNLNLPADYVPPTSNINPNADKNAPPATSETPAPTSTTGATRGLFSDVVSSIQKQVGDTSGIQQAQQGLQNLTQKYGQMVGDVEQTPLDMALGTGRLRALADTYSAQVPYYQQALQTAQNVRGQNIGALQNVAGLAPEAMRYGAFSGGGGGAFDPATAATNYADEVISGKRSYSDAIKAMGLYGSAAQQFLDQAIRTKRPDFSFSQAQSLGGMQGEVAPALTLAQRALDNLTKTFSNTPEWQKTSSPMFNSLTNLLANVGIGTGTATSKGNAINEARTQVANALGVMTNTTPSAWTAMVGQWFPDNATPEQVTAGIEQFNNLAKNRQAIYGTPGQVTPFTPTQGNEANLGGIKWVNKGTESNPNWQPQSQ